MDMEVLNAINHAGTGEKIALVTIVQTTGSTPRKAGAQMLVFAGGRVVGTIGGGCGEAEVRQAALQVMDDGGARLHRVNLTNQIAGEEGMVCGGVMEVFIESLR